MTLSRTSSWRLINGTDKIQGLAQEGEQHKRNSLTVPRSGHSSPVDSESENVWGSGENIRRKSAFAITLWPPLPLTIWPVHSFVIYNRYWIGRVPPRINQNWPEPTKGTQKRSKVAISQLAVNLEPSKPEEDFLIPTVRVIINFWCLGPLRAESMKPTFTFPLTVFSSGNRTRGRVDDWLVGRSIFQRHSTFSTSTLIFGGWPSARCEDGGLRLSSSVADISQGHPSTFLRCLYIHMHKTHIYFIV